MPSTPPEGQPVPLDGSLPAAALRELRLADCFGIYVHVPFCASRCGYCDFNTYTATELGAPPSLGRNASFSGTRESYVEAVLAELALATRVLDAAAPAVTTVFFGGGTPTLLPTDDLARILDGIDKAFGLQPSAEVTTEANPESVAPESLRALRRAGFTRISLGMQSVAPHVLTTLDRRHTPGRATEAAAQAREAGFDHVNLDLIYGTPGERAEDFAASLDAVVRAGVDHVSAYSLIVEDGTRLATRVRRGELAAPDDDVAADRYLAAEERLAAAGFGWYEVSNWARSADAACRHNLGYWRGDHWWGLGPGAHSHVGGVRWWNVRHPTPYARLLGQGHTPAQAREVLTTEQRHVEEVMLRVRLAEGLPLGHLTEHGQAAAVRSVDQGLLDPAAHAAGRAVLTLRGRLLADAVVRDLVE